MVTYLAQARAAGAAMVLALNTDESVRRLGKGDDRPINTLDRSGGSGGGIVQCRFGYLV